MRNQRSFFGLTRFFDIYWITMLKMLSFWNVNCVIRAKRMHGFEYKIGLLQNVLQIHIILIG